MHFPSPSVASATHVAQYNLSPDSSLTDLKAFPLSVKAQWFIHVSKHDLLKHTQSVNPFEELKDVVCHWVCLVCSYLNLPREEFSIDA